MFVGGSENSKNIKDSELGKNNKGEFKDKKVEVVKKEPKKSVGFFKYGEHWLKSKILPSYTVITVNSKDKSKFYLQSLSAPSGKLDITQALLDLSVADPTAIKSFKGLNRLHAISIMTNIELLEKNGLSNIFKTQGDVEEIATLKKNLEAIKENLKQSYDGLENLGSEDRDMKKLFVKGFNAFISITSVEEIDLKDEDEIDVINLEGVNIIEKDRVLDFKPKVSVYEKLDLNSVEDKKSMEKGVEQLFSEKSSKMVDSEIDKRLWDVIDRNVYEYYDVPIDKVGEKDIQPTVRLDIVAESKQAKKDNVSLDKDKWRENAADAHTKYFGNKEVSVEVSKLIHQELPILFKNLLETKEELYEKGDQVKTFFTISPESGKRGFSYVSSEMTDDTQGLDFKTIFSVYRESKNTYSVKAEVSFVNLNKGMDQEDNMFDLDPKNSYAKQTTMFKVSFSEGNDKKLVVKCENISNTLEYKLVLKQEDLKKE